MASCSSTKLLNGLAHECMPFFFPPCLCFCANLCVRALWQPVRRIVLVCSDSVENECRSLDLCVVGAERENCLLRGYKDRPLLRWGYFFDRNVCCFGHAQRF